MQMWPMSKQFCLGGYNITQCCDVEGKPCGCYTALKKIQACPQCKIHGEKADAGARKALQAFCKAEYSGPVFTQFPIYSEMGRNVSRAQPSMARANKSKGKARGGIFRKGVLKLDLLLSSAGSSPRFVAVEVQGKNHRDKRVKHRDGNKVRAVNGSSFELPLHAVHTEGVQYRPMGTRTRTCVAIYLSKDDMTGPYDSVVQEVMNDLRVVACGR